MNKYYEGFRSSYNFDEDFAESEYKEDLDTLLRELETARNTIEGILEVAPFNKNPALQLAYTELNKLISDHPTVQDFHYKCQVTQWLETIPDYPEPSIQTCL